MNTLRLAVRRSHTSATLNSLAAGRRLYSTSPRKCPSCSSPLPTALPTCPKCFYIEPLPATTSFFDLLGLSRTQSPLDIDTKDLRQRFLKAQRICHPDAWSGKTEKDQNMAAVQSSLLNEAYKTLQSPVLRAQYLLTQEGFPPSETDKLTDREMVMEIMDARGDIEMADTLDEVMKIHQETVLKFDKAYKRLETLIDKRKWEEARDAVVELKYLEGIKEAAKQKSDSFS